MPHSVVTSEMLCFTFKNKTAISTYSENLATQNIIRIRSAIIQQIVFNIETVHEIK